MVDINTKQIESFGKALSWIVTYVLIGFSLQRVGYLLPEWHFDPESVRSPFNYGSSTKWKSWMRRQYRQWLVFVPIKYIGNLLYFVVLPLQYFVVLSRSFSTTSSPLQYLIFSPNLAICVISKSFLLAIAGLFSVLLAYSNRTARKTESGILTTEEDVTRYMMNARQILLHDHPLAKWCVFGLFFTSTLDIAVGVPLIDSLYGGEYTEFVYLYNVVQLLFVLPFCMFLLDVAMLSVQHKYRKLKEQERVIKETMALQRKEQEQEMMYSERHHHRQKHRDSKPHRVGVDNAHNQRYRGNSPPGYLVSVEEASDQYYDRFNDNQHEHEHEHQHHQDQSMNRYHDEDHFKSSRDASPTVPDSDSYEDDTDTQHLGKSSAARNVFLASISKAQHESQAMQHQQDALRLSRLNRLANLPFQTRGSIHSASIVSPSLSPRPISNENNQLELNNDATYSTAITPQNTEATFESMFSDRIRATTRGLRKRTSNKKTERTDSIQLPLSMEMDGHHHGRNQHLHHLQVSGPKGINSSLSASPGMNENEIKGDVTGSRSKGEDSLGKMTCDNIGCRLLGRILLNPMIIASAAALLCHLIQFPQNELEEFNHFLDPIQSIYKFLSLMVIGGILSVLMRNRRSIFQFAAQSHRRSKSQILKRLNRHRHLLERIAVDHQRDEKHRDHESMASINPLVGGRTQINQGQAALRDVPSSPVSPPVFSLPNVFDEAYHTNGQKKFSEEAGKGTMGSVWTYSKSETGGIHFRQKRMTITEIDDLIKKSTEEDRDHRRGDGMGVVITKQDTNHVNVDLPTSISLMNTDNVMMWWWALSFVVCRYLFSALSFRFISLGIYDIATYQIGEQERDDLMVVNYLYGALAPTLFPLVLAMKYNIYISFITLCYMMSIILYPLMAFGGLLLFTAVECGAMQEAAGSMVLGLQVVSIVLCILVVIFWCGFKHWRTFPVSIFVAGLSVDLIEGVISLFIVYPVLFGNDECDAPSSGSDSSSSSSDDDASDALLLIIYILRQWLRLLVLAAAFQCCLLISVYTISKRELRKYHRITLPITALFSILVAFILWWVRCDDEWTNKILDADHGWNASSCSWSGVYESKIQMQIDGVLQMVYMLLLFCMFWYILRKRYQYAISTLLRDNKSLNQGHSLWFRVFFCCFLKCCKCGSTRYRHRRRRSSSKHHIREPLLSPMSMSSDGQMMGGGQHSLVEINSATTNMTLSRHNGMSAVSEHHHLYHHHHHHHDESQTVQTMQTVDTMMNDESTPSDQIMIDGKQVEIQMDYHTGNEADSSLEHSGCQISRNGNDHRQSNDALNDDQNLNQSRFESRIECDPASLSAYYGFDYYAYTLIIYCCALMGFLIDILHYLYQYLSTEENKSLGSEVLMMLSMLRRGRTVFIAFLFLTTKPIKRLVRDLWSRCRIRCRLLTRGVKDKVGESMDEEDTEMEVFAGRDEEEQHQDRINTSKAKDQKKNMEAHRKKKLKLPRSFYHRLPVLF